MLSFDQLRKANASRCKRWRKAGIEEWSVTDWAELDAVYNATITKLPRIETGAQNRNDLTGRSQAIASIGEALAERLIYLDLLAHRLGIDLAAETIKKFNAISRQYGCPERLE